MTDVYISQPATSFGNERALLDQQAEQAAFERGRMQGEMEAIRRVEAEAPLKQMQPTQQEINAATLERPDVLEINRLTWLQKAAAVLGELSAITFVTMTVVYLAKWREGYGWGENGDETNYVGHFDVGYLCFALGLFCHGQAISNYRILPLNTSANFNRALYCMWQAFTLVGYTLALTAIIQSTPAAAESIGETGGIESEATFWTTAHWCMALAFTMWLAHMTYSVMRTCFDRVRPVTYETWAEVDSHLEEHGQLRDSNSLRKDMAYDAKNRTIYTPAPVTLSRTAAHIPAANANMNAQVPVAPANAPRWSENPHTHAEDYFFIARAKWGIVAFWSCGVAFLMLVSMQEAIQASSMRNWAQGSFPSGDHTLNQTGHQAHFIGGLGLVTLMFLIFLSYAAMPPRTTLVKNGVLVEPRRASISHNAETRLGHNAV